MARKTKIIKDELKGRDAGKVFLITELDAWAAEAWATEALFAMMNAGVDIPEGIENAGLAGVAALGLSALTKVPYDKAKPLIEKMMSCVQVVLAVTRPLIADDIEEVGTLLLLKKEVLLLHLDFFTSGGASILGSAAASTTPA